MTATQTITSDDVVDKLLGDATEIEGGWCIKQVDGACIDVMKTFYNYRVILSDRQPGLPPHLTYRRGWCYFGHGKTASGKERTMSSALLAALLAAAVWDGVGEPAGYDKVAGA